METKISNVTKLMGSYLDSNIAVFLHGKPGVGKSAIVAQEAARRQIGFIDIRAILLDPVDLRGVPYVDDGRSYWAPADFLPQTERDGVEGILLLDELNAAPVSVMNACLQLVLDRKLGEYELPPGWRIVAAGNRREDRASVHKLPAPLSNRFAHIDVVEDVDDWAAWAMNAGVRSEVIAFLRFKPDQLHRFDTGGGEPREFPSPRGWEMVSRLMESGGLAQEQELPAFSGIVGEAAASELMGFMRVYRNLPSIDGILLDPDNADIPGEPSAKYALATALARKASQQTIDSISRYLDRLAREFQVVTWKDIIARDSSLQQTQAFQRWGISNQDLFN